MAGDPQDSQSRFYFTQEQLANSPSRKCGMDADTELQYRQRAANLIQDMGQRLHVSQLCINTAIVYMHRYYAFHSFTHFHRNSIAAAALFLAAKVEEQPRKLEHVIKVSHLCLNQEPPDPTKEAYQELAQDLVFNENVLLQTLGFDVAIDHPHTHVVKTCGLVKASKELAQTSYFMASNSLHLTTMCLQYRPTVVACFCIHLACKWSRWEIPQSTEGKHWFQYVDKTVTLDLLKQLTDEFLHIFDKCPTRLKRLKTLNNSTFQAAEEQRKAKEEEQAAASSSSSSSGNSQHHKSHHGHHTSKVPPLDHQKSSSSSRMSSNSQMPQQRPKIDRPSTAHSSSYPVNSDKNLIAGSSQNMRPPSGTSSRDPHFNKSRPHSMGGSSSQSSQQQQQQQQQTGGVNVSSKDRHSTGNGQPSSQHMKHEGNSNKMMKIHPTNIGVGGQGMDPTMRKQPYPGQSHKMPSGYNQSTLQKHKSMPSQHSSSMKQQQQQQNSKHHQSSSQSSSGQQLPQNQSHSLPQQPQMPPPQPSSQSFKLLDESVLTDTTLKTSPTHSQQSKPSSIFSPDWKDSSSSIPMPALTQTMSSRDQNQQQQQQRQPSSQSSNRHNNTSNSQHNLFSSSKSMTENNKKPPQQQQMGSQPPPLIGIGMTNELDYMKQEKLCNEPPQQLLATKDMRDSMKLQQQQQQSLQMDMKSIKRPPSSMEEEQQRDVKLRRLEARMEGSDTIPELTAAIKSEELKMMNENMIKREPMSDKWQQQQTNQQMQQKRADEAMMRQQQAQQQMEQMKRDKWNKNRPRDMMQELQQQQQQQQPPPLPPVSSYNDTQSMMYQHQQQQNLGVALTQQNQNQMSGIPPSMMMPPQNETKLNTVKPLSSVNGIETNPDVIRNLLKESLVDTKFGSSLAASHPTLHPISDTPGQLLNDPGAEYSSMTATNMSDQSQNMSMAGENVDGGHHRKSEKKKKKEKHKHKEKSKDKDKDREERKKHKKDKDRHRDKSRDRSDSHHISIHQQAMLQQQQQPHLPSSQNPQDNSINMKITIPKTKISLSMTGQDVGAITNPLSNPHQGGLKIKIPKDRIKSSSAAPPPPPTGNDQAGIKIKISRNAIEGYKQQ
uniref:CSON011270 protein n=1 Tax=Culicoides sonorensis TaxID=179676 RepID=A0A336M388_CULSO